MGGDDLASDDEFLFDSGLIDSSTGRGTAVPSSDEDSSSVSDDDVPIPSKKRKGVVAVGTEDTAATDSDVILPSESKKSRNKEEKVPKNSKKILIHAGRGIAMDTQEHQATFLETIYSHSLKLSDGADGGETFSFQPHLYSTPATTDDKTRQFQHSNLAAFLRSGPLPSMKRLKNWKHPQSPMVLVITLSARRSVELMKQLSSLKLPIAKLFAKHMSVEDQLELLRGVGGKAGNAGRKRCYSLAVGTPGRLLKLLRHGRDDGPESGGALRLKHTEVVIIDNHEDSKGWTVCTLNDTSKELMEFMKEGVVPQLEQRKSKIKVAMF